MFQGRAQRVGQLASVTHGASLLIRSAPYGLQMSAITSGKKSMSVRAHAKFLVVEELVSAGAPTKEITSSMKTLIRPEPPRLFLNMNTMVAHALFPVAQLAPIQTLPAVQAGISLVTTAAES
jgi:hypothetical protein